MGFKFKLTLLVIAAALIGYIWYFQIPFSPEVLVFTGAAALAFILDFMIDSPQNSKRFMMKSFLILIVAALIFYIWYFDVPINTIPIGIAATVVIFIMLGIVGPKVTRNPYVP